MVLVALGGAITMTNNHTSPPAHDHHSAAAVASIWVLLLVLIGVIEIGSLLLSGSMLAAVFP